MEEHARWLFRSKLRFRKAGRHTFRKGEEREGGGEWEKNEKECENLREESGVNWLEPVEGSLEPQSLLLLEQ